MKVTPRPLGQVEPGFVLGKVGEGAHGAAPGRSGAASCFLLRGHRDTGARGAGIAQRGSWGCVLLGPEGGSCRLAPGLQVRGLSPTWEACCRKGGCFALTLDRGVCPGHGRAASPSAVSAPGHHHTHVSLLPVQLTHLGAAGRAAALP